MARIDHTGRVAIVTGAGRGIGRAHAHELARRGASVLVNGAHADTTFAVLEEITARGGDAAACVADVSTVVGGRHVVETALERWGRLDVVVNNAARRSPGPFESFTDDDLDPVFDSQLRAAFAVTQPAWRAMRETGFGRIVMTSSSGGLFGAQDLSNYATAKAGLYGLARAIAYEGRDLGITCNVIVPYAVTKSPGNERLERSAEAERKKYVADADVARIDPARWDPSLSARLVAFLTSGECTVTGEAFSCCLGRYARVFVGVTEGWIAPDPVAVDAEAIADHFEQIRDATSYSVPGSMYDELADVVGRIVGA